MIILLSQSLIVYTKKLTLDTIEKILRQKAYKDKTNIRAFLGIVVQYWNYISNFVTVTAPLYKVIKNIPFEWESAQEKAQSDLETLIESCFHTQNPKFSSISSQYLLESNRVLYLPKRQEQA